MKIDQQKNALAGAEFKVTDAETGQTVARSLRSDNQGLVQVNHLQQPKAGYCLSKWQSQTYSMRAAKTTCIQKQNQISQQRNKQLERQVGLVYRNQHTSQLLLCLYRPHVGRFGKLALL